MILTLQRNDLDVRYKKGTELYLAYTPSRHFSKLTETTRGHRQHVLLTRSAFEEGLEVKQDIQKINHLLVNEHETEMFRVDTMTDDLLQAVMALVQSGWLEDKRKLTPAVAMCYDMHDELVVQDGLLFLIIPKALPKPMLQALHSGHQGIESTFRLTRKTIYWPNMKSDVKHFTSRFETCATYGIRQQKETFISHDVPDHRWATIQQTSLGYTTRVYMVTVDYFSSFFEVDRLYDLIASTVIKKLKGHMA